MNHNGDSSAGEKISVLCVDDDETHLYLTRRFLETTGTFRVDTLPSAKMALESLKIREYDAIVSDYQMPETDGIEFLKLVRERLSDIPFILFTVKAREEVVIDAINYGADYYIQKGTPQEVAFAELAHRIMQAVQSRQAKRSLLDSERYIADIINFLPDATFAIDRSGHVIAWNRAIEEMTGISSRDMLGKGNYEYALPFYGTRRPILVDLIDEPDETISAYYTNVYRTDESLTAETDLPHPKGTRITTLVKVSRLYNKAGEIIGAIESIRDITPIKRAEEKLRESEKRFRGMAERSSDLILVLNSEMSPVYVSPSARLIIGYEPEELVGKPSEFALNTIFSKTGPELMNVVRTTWDGGVIDTLETRLTKKDGTVVFVNLYVVPIIQDGAVTGAQVSIRDITERKRIESATQALILSMVETTGDNSLQKIPETICSWLNADSVLIGEISQDREQVRVLSMILDGKEVSPFSYPVRGSPCEEVIKGESSLFADDVSRNFSECRHISEQCFQGYIGTPLCNSDKEIIGVLCVLFRKPVETTLYVRQIIEIIAVKVAADIERSRIEQTLIESRHMLAEAMDLAHLVNWEYDAVQDLFTFNDRFYSMYGTTAEREGGYVMTSADYARKFIHSADYGVVADEIQKAVMATDPGFISQREHRIIRRDGELRYIIVRYEIIKDAEGRTVRTKGANQDITERKKAELALRQANRQLNLLSSITRHDILNMVTVLLMYLEKLQMDYDDPDLLSSFQNMMSATKMIQAQIEFTRVYEDLGIHEPRWQKLVDIMPYSHLHADITFHAELEDFSIFADPMLEKVFFNLLDNSIRHGRTVTEISVSAQQSDDSLVIVWEDNGVGIPEEEKGKIFDRGFGKNTGLGMFLARDILSLTGITIQERGIPESELR